ncbi:MAG: hypothetical protein HY270_03625 [Deltaproteobacteria bacterium]|nr:hypothetical protein [Deltaproteobacteria bacterium]
MAGRERESPASAAAHSAGSGSPSERRVLLVNLDFRDFVYSHLWGRAVLDACARRNRTVDVVTVNPFAGRNLAEELGVARSAVELPTRGEVIYVDAPDDTLYRSVIAHLLERQRYDTLILNCDAPLFVYLMVERRLDFVRTRWLIYDRHLHIGLQTCAQDARLRERVAASDLHLFTIQEISTGAPPAPPTVAPEYSPDNAVFGVGAPRDRTIDSENALVRFFKRLRKHDNATVSKPSTVPETSVVQQPQILPDDTGIIRLLLGLGVRPENLHLQPWPLDEAFFAPRPATELKDRFVIFSGGDSGRDYGTLFAAMSDLPIELRLCANRYPQPLPPNVTLLPRLPLHRFRDEVAQAAAVVVPITGHPPVSGITVVAMAKMMGKPVIASDNEVVRMHISSSGHGGLLAEVGNVASLRSLLTRVIQSPRECERLAWEGRAQASRDLSLRAFVERMLSCERHD